MKNARKLLTSTASALAFCAAPSAVWLVAGAVAPALAQDYTSGAFAGRVTDASGNPVAGASVTLRSEAQGFERSATTSDTGAFRFPGLTPGDYSVSVESDAGSISQSGLNVRASATADYTFVVGEASAADSIVVTGVRQNRDFSNTTTGINLDVTELTKSIPVGRTVTDLTLFAPGAVQGDSFFGDLPSAGGSSVAENAYYLNGMNITNFDNYLGSAPVPFEFLQSVEVKTGGYQAEFGRATGAVINAVSKSGTNDWSGGLHLNWEPEWLVSNSPDTYQERNRRDEQSSVSAIVELGGPIIEDRLFIYGLAQFQDVSKQDVSIVSNAVNQDTETDPIWALKADAYPLDDHHLEFTYFDTSTQKRRTTLAYDPDADTFGEQIGSTLFNSGGESYVGKYTGAFTEWLTVSGAYGVSKDSFEVLPSNSGNYAIDYTVGGGTATSSQTETSVVTPYNTRREFYRADIDLYFNFLGDHHIRAGFDRENNTLSKVEVLTGSDNIDGGGIALAPGGVLYETLPCGAATPQCIAAGLMENDPYVAVNYSYSGGFFDGENTAYYLQDEWAITPQLTLNLGVRLDQFANFDAGGAKWVEFDNEWAPRVGFSYDVFGDGGTRLFGSYGQYYLPIASAYGFTFFGSGFSFQEFWQTSGVDGGIPVLTDQITGWAGGQPCPFPVFGSGGSDCRVIGDGSVPTADTFVARNIKPTKEQEFILGVEHQLNDLWTVGVTYTRRNLLSSAEDIAIDAGVLDYCEAEGISGCDSIWVGYHQYVLANPGEDVTVTLDTPINGESTLRTVTLTAEDLLIPSPIRKYDSLEFSFARAFDGLWALQGSYLWSNSRGNTEGSVRSDTLQDGPSFTADFDQPGLMDGAYGKLANHRAHQFKIWGSYQVTEDFLVGANASLASPRKFGCIGNHADFSDIAWLYGSFNNYCLNRLQPRGTGLDGAGLESDWFKNVDISLRYDVELVSGVEMTMRADVFNVFGFNGVTRVDEKGEDDYANGALRPEYGMPLSYQQPRYVRLGVDLQF